MFVKRFLTGDVGIAGAPCGAGAAGGGSCAGCGASGNTSPGGGPAGEAPANTPRIFSPEPTFDFGSQDNEGKVEHDFTVMNVGTGTLEISDVKSSCGCTVAEMAKKSWLPARKPRSPPPLI